MPSTTLATRYGYQSTIWAPFPVQEAKTWFDDIKAVVGAPHAFGQLIDLRGQKPYGDETNQIIEEAMRYVRERGMERSAVILASAITKLQIMRLAKQAGMYAYERYFDASSQPDWEAQAIAWIERGLDPDAG